MWPTQLKRLAEQDKLQESQGVENKNIYKRDLSHDVAAKPIATFLGLTIEWSEKIKRSTIRQIFAARIRNKVQFEFCHSWIFDKNWNDTESIGTTRTNRPRLVSPFCLGTISSLVRSRFGLTLSNFDVLLLHLVIDITETVWSMYMSFESFFQDREESLSVN